jgi:hypothetical protein
MPDISASELERARSMRAEGLTWEEIGRRLEYDCRSIRRRLDPEWAERTRKRDRNYTRHYLSKQERVETQHEQGPRHTPQEIAALRRLIPPDTRDLTARTFNDPLPGRSALDQKLSGASV